MVRAKVCETLGYGFKSRQPPQKYMTTGKLLKLNSLRQGGDSVDQATLDLVEAVLRNFDRLDANPYFPGNDFLRRVVDEYGYLTLMLFVCPKMRGKYLDTAEREKFMPIEEPADGLIFARLPKLQELVRELWAIGIPTKLIFVVGDNGFEMYKGPSIGVYLDTKKMDERRQQYLENLASQLTRVFHQLLEVVSLGLMKVEPAEVASIPTDVMDREMTFQSWSFDKYYGGRKPDAEGLRKLAKTMIESYSAEGFVVEMADAVLIGTEGTDLASWTRRIEMFQLGGARFPVIFPYIRKEELDEA